MPSSEEAYADVLEICALLQCLGFTVKSLDNSETNTSQDAGPSGARSVVINCQTSGLHVVLEGTSPLCSCPVNHLQTSGFWQISAVTGGKRRDTETGSSILASLPKSFREKLSANVQDLVRSIRHHNESQNLDASVPVDGKTDGLAGQIDGLKGVEGQVEMSKSDVLNRSVSMLELKSTPPGKSELCVKPDTPTRYRSLDALTNKVNEEQELPPPGLLARQADAPCPPNRLKYCRQSTYMVRSPEKATGSNRTSSPIQQRRDAMERLENKMALVELLMEAEGTADKLRERLTKIIKVMAVDDEKHDSSMSLDVSKISVLKGPEPSHQYASSPNIATQPTEPALRPRGAVFESVSTLNLASKSGMPSTMAPPKPSKFRKMSPNIFKRRDSPSVSDRSGRLNDAVRSCPRPRIATPVQRTPKTDTSANKSVCSSLKKKYSHIKSTIPRFTGKKETPASLTKPKLNGEKETKFPTTPDKEMRYGF